MSRGKHHGKGGETLLKFNVLLPEPTKEAALDVCCAECKAKPKQWCAPYVWAERKRVPEKGYIHHARKAAALGLSRIVGEEYEIEWATFMERVGAALPVQRVDDLACQFMESVRRRIANGES